MSEIERLKKIESVAKEVYPLRHFCFGADDTDADGPLKLFRAIKRFSSLFEDRYSANPEEQEASLNDEHQPQGNGNTRSK